MAAEQRDAGVDPLGRRLRALRRQRGLSLREVAERLHVSVSAVSQIERGVLQPSVNRLLAIASALGVPLARVFDEPEADRAAGDGARMAVWSVAGTPVRHEPVDDATDDQTAGSTDLGALGDGAFGVWEITPGVSTDVEADEVAVIVAGRGTVEDLDTGAVVQLAPGTVLRLAAGVRTRWTVVETLRKVYVLR